MTFSLQNGSQSSCVLRHCAHQPAHRPYHRQVRSASSKVCYITGFSVHTKEAVKTAQKSLRCISEGTQERETFAALQGDQGTMAETATDRPDVQRLELSFQAGCSKPPTPAGPSTNTRASRKPPQRFTESYPLYCSPGPHKAQL